MYLEFGFSIMAAGKKMDKGQARMGQNPRQVRKYSTCWLLWFFFPFFWIFHSDLTHSQCSTVTGEFFLGRAEKLKILTLKWESSFSHSNATSDVGIQLGINGTELKVFPKPEKKNTLLLNYFISFLSTWGRVLIDKIWRRKKKSLDFYI